MPNMLFTPSADNWIRLFDQVAVMDIDTALPAHGDVATQADVKETPRPPRRPALHSARPIDCSVVVLH